MENVSGGKTNTKESTNSPIVSISKPQSYAHQSRKYELKICDLNEEIRLFNGQGWSTEESPKRQDSDNQEEIKEKLSFRRNSIDYNIRTSVEGSLMLDEHDVVSRPVTITYHHKGSPKKKTSS